ncbi:type II toxin-antitoxin system HicB family antitoxin [Lactiplantibacillus sp. WILCCON 0030]|uniref:Type II toxin-antitoxin system HicB family antitoxin n=1 Tax=Lactiplantibacillus brownii TaxID=3069269 RepID=A0ABU1ABH5_9LACO|nr:type II toxin-antitoxin system HicB family antitoxin [Lactiplantibacillus brownii]MDQ7938275.1 type II toxin-antitoxin system HicB family antitoxin [Lactiplantibacillus brownii]
MKKNDRIVVYPAILTPDPDEPDFYAVEFPDVSGALSQGKGIANAMAMGSEALGLMLSDARNLPTATDIKTIKQANKNAIITYITTNLTEIAKKVRKPLVRKNVTIPENLAEQAKANGINFSEVLTQALTERLEA